MKMSKLQITIASVAIFLTLLFIWPTLYRYEKIQGPSWEHIVKLNRITGDTYILDIVGDEWIYIPGH